MEKGQIELTGPGGRKCVPKVEVAYWLKRGFTETAPTSVEDVAPRVKAKKKSTRG